MFKSILRPASVCTALSLAAFLAPSESLFAQGVFELNPKSSGSTNRSTPLHSLPQAAPKLGQPSFPATPKSSSKQKPSQGQTGSSFGGSGFALPRPATRPTTKPTKSTGSPSQLPQLGEAGSSQRDRSGKSNIGSTSNSGRQMFIGSCNVKLMQDIMIPAEEEGLLSELDIKEGDAAEANKVIGTIDTERLEIEADRAALKLDIQREKAADTSAISVALKKYKLAKSEYETAVRLGRKGSRSNSEVKRAKYSMEASYAEIKVAQNQRREAIGLARLEEINLKQIKFVIGKMQIATPFDGHVLEILKHPQEYVQKGENIIRFARLDKLWVEATVSSESVNPTDIIGQPVTVLLNQAGNELEFKGRVVSVPLKMEGIGKRFRVRAEVDNRFESGIWLLRPGASLSMTVDLNANTAQSRNARVKR